MNFTLEEILLDTAFITYLMCASVNDIDFSSNYYLEGDKVIHTRADEPRSHS
jgi:hypothetical protein